MTKMTETRRTSKAQSNVQTRPLQCEQEKLEVATEQAFGSDDKVSGTDDLCEKHLMLPEIKSVENDVLQYIIGQDTQVKQIITAIYRAIYFKSIKSNVLIIGSSGTGKTETIRQVAKRLNIPYTIEDATKYTKEGYYGANVSDMIYNLLENADHNLESAEYGIIVVDEIDKKVGNDLGDVAGVEVLKSMLKIIEGTKIKIEDQRELFDECFVDFDTSNLIIIFLGAFSGLDKIREKRLNTNQLGFCTNDDKKQNGQEMRILKQDLVKYGMPEEFVGRIDTIIEMNKLQKKDLSLILQKSKLSIFRRYETELEALGIELVYDEAIFDKIADASLKLDTGARELSNTVNRIFENIIYDIISNPNGYTKCTLDLDIVSDNTKYKLS